jgi:hypothetical protein
MNSRRAFRCAAFISGNEFMRTILKSAISLALMVMAPALAVAADENMSGMAVDLLLTLEVMGKIVSCILLVGIIFMMIVKQDILPMFLGMPVVLFFGYGVSVTTTLLGIELPGAEPDAPMLIPGVGEWFISNSWIFGVVLLTVIAGYSLISRLLTAQLRKAHRPAVAHWKVRLLDALAEGQLFIDDEVLRLELAGASPDTDPATARQVLRDMVRIVSQADLYDYGGPTSFRGTGCIHSKLREIMREERCGCFVKQALVPMCEVLESMPRSLHEALKTVAEELSYDDLLRLQLNAAK